MSASKNKTSGTKVSDTKPPLKLSTTFDNNTHQLKSRQPYTPHKRRRHFTSPSPSPSNQSPSPSSDDQDQSTKGEPDDDNDDDKASEEIITTASPWKPDPFNINSKPKERPRPIKPLRRSRNRTQKFTSSTPPDTEEANNGRFPQTQIQMTANITTTTTTTAAASAAHRDTPPTSGITPGTDTPTPTTSAEWCQASHDDPAAVSLALATRDMTSINVGSTSGDRGGMDHQEGDGERSSSRKKRQKKKKQGFGEEEVARWFESVASPGGFEPLPGFEGVIEEEAEGLQEEKDGKGKQRKGKGQESREEEEERLES